MLKVTFKLHHPTLGFDQAMDKIAGLYEGTNYKQRMIENDENGIRIKHRDENVNDQIVNISYWKDRESNEAWTESIYNTPETLQFYKNLENAGFQWTVIKEDVESLE